MVIWNLRTVGPTARLASSVVVFKWEAAGLQRDVAAYFRALAGPCGGCSGVYLAVLGGLAAFRRTGPMQGHGAGEVAGRDAQGHLVRDALDAGVEGVVAVVSFRVAVRRRLVRWPGARIGGVAGMAGANGSCDGEQYHPSRRSGDPGGMLGSLPA